MTSRPTSASMSPAVTTGRASWGPASATQGTRARAVKKWIAWILPARDEECVCAESVTVLLAGEEPTARRQEPRVWTSALVMGPSSPIPDSAAAILTGLATIAQSRFVQQTAEDTEFASEAPAAARRAGWAQPVINERVTHAAMSTGHAGMASVNAAQAGTESTALLRDALACAMGMADALWT